jgi:superfamily II DNA/RNA helicase
MHGDKSQGQRERALAAFEAGRCAVLVATDVAARGLDVDGITHVVNFDAPEDRESYVHRAGRTGRAGNSGHSVTFVMEDQARDIGRLAGQLSLTREFAAAGLRGPDPTHRHGGDQGHRHTPRPAGRSSRRRHTRRG